MSFDGSGTFSLIYNWATEAASPPIAISKLDTEMAGIATGLSSCMLRTGGTVTGATTFNAAVTLSSTAPLFYLYETDAATDEKYWRMSASGGDFYIIAANDSLVASATPLLITRTGTTVDAITLAATQINFTCTATAVNGTLGISGNVAVNTDKFTVAAASGNTVVAGTLTVNSLSLTPSNGNFTMELATEASGGSVLASGTAYWKIIGGVVTLRCPALYATTTDDTLFIRGIPAAIQPALTGTYTQGVVVGGLVNGSVLPVEIRIAEGVAYWSIIGLDGTGFTSGSASKGIGTAGNTGPTITYQISD